MSTGGGREVAGGLADNLSDRDVRAVVGSGGESIVVLNAAKNRRGPVREDGENALSEHEMAVESGIIFC